MGKHKICFLILSDQNEAKITDLLLHMRQNWTFMAYGLQETDSCIAYNCQVWNRANDEKMSNRVTLYGSF